MPSDVLDSEQTRLLAALGFLASGAGLDRQALTLFQQLSRLRPERSFGPVGWASHLLRQGRCADAVWVLQRSLRLMPAHTLCDDLAEVRGWLGLSLLANGEQSLGLQALRDSLAVSPSSAVAPMARSMLGQPS